MQSDDKCSQIGCYLWHNVGFSKHILPIVEKIIEYDKDTNKVEIDVTLYGS